MTFKTIEKFVAWQNNPDNPLNTPECLRFNSQLKNEVEAAHLATHTLKNFCPRPFLCKT